MRGKFSYTNPRLLFQGRRVDFLSIEAPHPHGGMMEREVIDYPGAVVILPLLDQETIVLIKNDRPAVCQTLLELPAGTLEKGEEPLSCAYRELEEETGYQAEKMTSLLSFYSTPGISNEIMHIFLAENLKKVGQNLEDSEKIEVVPTPIVQIKEMLCHHAIYDAKTLCGLLYYFWGL